MVNVSLGHHIVMNFPRLANMAWTFDLDGQTDALSQPVISLSAHMSIPPEPFAPEL